MPDTRSVLRAAIVTSTAMIAYQVGAKATRDAMFLSSFGVKSLPSMMLASSLFAILLSFAAARALTLWGPARVVPAAFAASAALLLVEWGISFPSPHAAAVIVYLHYGCLGALLISGFWSFVSERLDPRTARRQLGRITTAGSLGGLLGGGIAAAVGKLLPVAAMLPILAVLHAVCALAVLRLRPEAPSPGVVAEPGRDERVRSSGLGVLARSSYLRALLSLVFLASVGEGLIDFALKGRAAAAFGTGGGLLRFFAGFYAAVSLLTVLVQAVASRAALEKLGPARSAAAYPAGVAVATAGALAAPGLTTAAVARATESVLSNSFFRGGYEVLFTPVPAREKRAMRTLADVGAVRVGDMAAAGAAQAVLLLALPGPYSVLLALASALTLVALVVSLGLHSGYRRSLERGLLSQAVRLDLSEVRDSLTRSTLLQTLGVAAPRGGTQPTAGSAPAIPDSSGAGEGPERRLRHLESGDPVRVIEALGSGPLDAALAPRVISLLSWDAVAREAIAALRRADSGAVPVLVERLCDPQEEFAVRRRIPLALGEHRDARAVEGLARGLSDPRFEVRYRCGRALSHLLALDPALRVRTDIVHAAVLREVEAGSGVWRGRRLLDDLGDESWSPMVDRAVRDRADRSLEHVFTLLALVLPRQPLRIAFRGLHAGDPLLRGTALEFLETVLPPMIRKPLWPHLEDDRRRGPVRAVSPEQALADLLRSSESIAQRLEDLSRDREGGAGPGAA